MATNARATHGLRGRRHWPLSLLAGTLILVIAVSAILSLSGLVAIYAQASRAAAAKSVIDYGVNLSRRLAEEPFFREAHTSSSAADFNQAVDWLGRMENSLQYVLVRQDNVILYQRQRGMDSGFGGESLPSGPPPAGRTTIGRKKIALGTNLIAVITFATAREGDGAQGRRVLEIGLVKEIIERENSASSSALKRIFRLAVTTIAASFALCLAAVIGLVHREITWQKRSRLEEHLAFAGSMAAGILHDFRNPLSAMRLDAQLMQAEAAKGSAGRPERQAELAGRIVRAVDRVDGILGEFLALGKPELSRREQFDANASVADCIEMLKPRFDKAGVGIVPELAPDPLQVSGFPVQFKRAVLNIMANAEQFSPRGGKVTIRTGRDGERAFVSVADEGPGIPRAERRKIFDLFYSKRPGGTGLGLSLARTAIESYGGRIECQDPPGGKGACFIISIPLSA